MQRWKLIAVGAAAAGIVVLGGGVAYATAAGAPATADAGARAATPSPRSPKADGRKARKGIRERMDHAMHGTATVRTKRGDKKVAMQRGTVTAASPTSLTVTSPDKIVFTYTMNGSTRVRLDRHTSDPGHVAKGQHALVITSPRSGTSVARLVVVRSS